MGISRYIFATVLACCALGSLQAANEALRHQKKHYLDEKAICVTKDGIAVNTKGGVVKVKMLRSDKNGVYVLARDVCKGDERYYCRRCHRQFTNYEDFATHYCRR